MSSMNSWSATTRGIVCVRVDIEIRISAVFTKSGGYDVTYDGSLQMRQTGLV